MKSITVKISEVKSNPNNPRIIKDDKFQKLVKSIKEFPEMLNIRPIVVNADMVVLGGNMRLKACKEAGLKEVAIIKAEDLTEEQQKQFIIKDNVGFGEWDWEDLANNWDAEQLTDWGLDIPNWDKGHDINEMNEDDVDTNEEFDPVGVSKGLTRLVIIFDSIIVAKEWIENNNLNLDYKKKGNDENLILQVNMSSNYGI
jgi:hypothetical protein